MSDENRILSRYHAEILRWNRQINLVSRRGGEPVLERLLDQCRQGWWVVERSAAVDLAGANRLLYIDLGSGGGLPGFVWHVLSAASCPARATLLVEPREKRAWFLDRLSTATGAPPLTVLNERWGASWPGNTHPRADRILISLKALPLEDSRVLAGLVGLGVPLVSGTRIDIVRFVPTSGRSATDPAIANPAAGLRDPDSREDILVEGARFLGSKKPRLSGQRLRAAGAELTWSRYSVVDFPG